MGILETVRKRKLFFDGGMGSLLVAKGLQPGELPETWNVTHPEVLQEIHLQYLRAGSDEITTNTFGANGLKFGSDGEFSLKRIVTAAVENAKIARGRFAMSGDYTDGGESNRQCGKGRMEFVRQRSKSSWEPGKRRGGNRALRVHRP